MSKLKNTFLESHLHLRTNNFRSYVRKTQHSSGWLLVIIISSFFYFMHNYLWLLSATGSDKFYLFTLSDVQLNASLHWPKKRK